MGIKLKAGLVAVSSVLILNCSGASVDRKEVRARTENLQAVESESTRDQLIGLGNDIMLKSGYKLDNLSVKVLEDSANYYTEYVFVKPGSKGGGGVIVFGKEDLQVKEKFLEE